MPCSKCFRKTLPCRKSQLLVRARSKRPPAPSTKGAKDAPQVLALVVALRGAKAAHGCFLSGLLDTLPTQE